MVLGLKPKPVDAREDALLPFGAYDLGPLRRQRTIKSGLLGRGLAIRVSGFRRRDQHDREGEGERTEDMPHFHVA